MKLSIFPFLMPSAAAGALALFGACSTATPAATPAGTPTEAGTDAQDASPPASDPCATKACPNDPAPTAEAVQSCRDPLSGRCSAEYRSYIDCVLPLIKCGSDGKLDAQATLSAAAACDARSQAYRACLSPAEAGPPDAPEPPDARPDTGPPTVNGCSSFIVATGPQDDRDIPWDFPIATDPRRCLQVKVGQTVTWTGNFTIHPLAPLGGDAPNPISATGTTTFPGAGTFGYTCTSHSSMRGAIRVVP